MKSLITESMRIVRVELEPVAGAHISAVHKECAALANAIDCEVHYSHNDRPYILPKPSLLK